MHSIVIGKLLSQPQRLDVVTDARCLSTGEEVNVLPGIATFKAIPYILGAFPAGNVTEEKVAECCVLTAAARLRAKSMMILGESL